MSIDLADAYAETHEHLADLVRGLSDDVLARIVPATPAWTVKDAVAHVTAEAYIAMTADVPPDLNLLQGLADRKQAEMRDALNAREIEKRRPAALEAVLEEWDGHADRLAPMLRGEQPFPYQHPFLGEILTADLAMHAQDVRGAVGVPGDRESAGVGVALGAFTFAMEFRLNALEMPGLRVRYGGKERVLGEEPVGAAVRADRFDLVRALTGRRSTRQIHAFEWEGDADQYVGLMPAYGPRDDDIVE